MLERWFANAERVFPKMRRRGLYASGLAFTLFLGAGFMLAQAAQVQQRQVFGTAQVMATLNNLSGILWIVLIGVAIIFFTIGGYRYLTSQGNAEEVKTANKMLIYGLVALAVGLVSRGLIYLVNDILAP